jgi:hypothetical protein
MGIGDNIKKAAENAMEDLAGTSDPHDDGTVPEPGQRDDDVQVHSSISEGSNAMDEPDDYPKRQGSASAGFADESGAGLSDRGLSDADQSASSTGYATESMPETSAERPDGRTDDSLPMGNPESPSGPAGLPGPAPDGLRADPSEADEDPSSSMGRG